MQPKTTAKFCANKKAFQSKDNRPLANRCMGYTVNKFEQDWEGSQVKKF